MASGFITLPNGKNWSARWSRYDLTLKIIMNRLNENGDEGYLKKWLHFILPTEDDIESGYCFFRVFSEDPYDSDSIVRFIDTRYLHPKYYEIFWQTVENLNNELDIETSIGFLMNDLYECFQHNQLPTGESIPEIEDKDDIDIFFMNGFNMGA
ncbi:hypothetical protein [Chryseobacterium jejuense]|uniref:Uncharacterized protein n=1 Tax=Chryseobacterium jejuense TaxID=445960 RepID=A0A2X2WZH4_CHRJE|nr:hypothetical protein [Chryseobacterium jejuense]SDJ57027.1 hypothetical protein SAMN05421542_3840 [Chryseobacterium jejuense]SQB46166.1 Uncharacterised protein [Chryseobacterium jejuense]